MTCTGHCEASYAAAAMQEEEKLRRLRAAKESPFPMPGGACQQSSKKKTFSAGGIMNDRVGSEAAVGKSSQS